jgi:hypothetical protein
MTPPLFPDGHEKICEIHVDAGPIPIKLCASQDKSGLIEHPTGFWVFPGEADEAAFFI